jgi:hypothetical protein
LRARDNQPAKPAETKDFTIELGRDPTLLAETATAFVCRDQMAAQCARKGFTVIFVLQNNPGGRKALAARKWLADNGPPDLQPLPLGYDERERFKRGGVDHILAWYSRSLDCRNYDVLAHPSFDLGASCTHEESTP